MAKNTIRNSEELSGGAIEQLEKARARLRKVEMEAEQFRVNGYSEIEQEKLNLINSTYKTLEQLENYKNETIHFEQQRMINQVRQRIFQQALQGAIGAILDLNQISDQSILIDCLHYVVASKYHYFWFWIFQIIPVGP